MIWIGTVSYTHLIEVEADNLLELRDNPSKYVTKKEDIEKLNDLFLLIDLLDKQEVE